MYLYYNKQGVLKEVSKNPIRQGDSFDLYVLFDKDVTLRKSALIGYFHTPDGIIPTDPLINTKDDLINPKEVDSLIDFTLDDEFSYAHIFIDREKNITNNAGRINLSFNIFQKETDKENEKENMNQIDLVFNDKNKFDVQNYVLQIKDESAFVEEEILDLTLDGKKDLYKIINNLNSLNIYIEPTQCISRSGNTSTNDELLKLRVAIQSINNRYF